MFAEYEVLKEKFERIVKKNKTLDVLDVGTSVATKSLFFVGSGVKIYKYIRYGNMINEAKRMVEAFNAVYTFTKYGSTGIKATLSAIKAGTIAAAGVPTAGLGTLAAIIAFAAIDILLQDFFDWLDNKNVCVLLPLWWNGYPFVSGVNNGKNILLIRDMPTEEDEQDAESFND